MVNNGNYVTVCKLENGPLASLIQRKVVIFDLEIGGFATEIWLCPVCPAQAPLQKITRLALKWGSLRNKAWNLIRCDSSGSYHDLCPKK